MLYKQLKPENIAAMQKTMRDAITYLPLVDIPIFFGFLIGRIELHQIIDPEIQKKEISNALSTDPYKLYKLCADQIHGKGMYPHALIDYYHRPLKRDGFKTIQDDIVPAIYAPISMIIWWTKFVLDMSRFHIQQMQSLLNVPLCCPKQLKGLLDCHYLNWAAPLYVNAMLMLY